MQLTSTPQFHQGMQIEAFLDDYFTALGYRIERLTAHEERIEKKGDRRF
jgi:hypothetical protein